MATRLASSSVLEDATSLGGRGKFVRRTNRPSKNVTLACDRCKKKHLRCDGGKPCAHCTKKDLACTYNMDRKQRGPKPKKQRAAEAPPSTPASATMPHGGSSPMSVSSPEEATPTTAPFPLKCETPAYNLDSQTQEISSQSPSSVLAKNYSAYIRAYIVNVKPIMYGIKIPLLKVLDWDEQFHSSHALSEKYLLLVILAVGARLCKDEKASNELALQAKKLFDANPRLLVHPCIHTGMAFLLLTYYYFGCGEIGQCSYYTMMSYWITQELNRKRSRFSHNSSHSCSSPDCVYTSSEFHFLKLFSLAHLASCATDAADRAHWIAKAMKLQPGAVDIIYLTVHMFRNELFHECTANLQNLLLFLDAAEEAVLRDFGAIQELEKLPAPPQGSTEPVPNFSWFSSFRFVLCAARAGIYWRSGRKEETAIWATKATIFAETEPINRNCIGCAMMLSFVLRFNVETGRLDMAESNLKLLGSYAQVYPIIRIMVDKFRNSMFLKRATTAVQQMRQGGPPFVGSTVPAPAPAGESQPPPQQAAGEEGDAAPTPAPLHVEPVECAPQPPPSPTMISCPSPSFFRSPPASPFRFDDPAAFFSSPEFSMAFSFGSSPVFPRRCSASSSLIPCSTSLSDSTDLLLEESQTPKTPDDTAFNSFIDNFFS